MFFPGGRRWAWLDLRPWGLDRVVARNPAAPGWPRAGERTEDEDVARRWGWRYVDEAQHVARARQLGLPGKLPPLGEAVEAYLAHRRDVERCAPNTLAADVTFLRTHLLPTFGARRPLAAIDAPALRGLFADLARADYAPRTLERYRFSASAFWRWALALAGPTTGPHALVSPVDGVVVPEVPEEDARAFTDGELALLRHHADALDGELADGVVYIGRWRAARARGDGGAPDVLAGRQLHTAPTRPPFSLRLALELGVNTGGREAELAALAWPAFRPDTHTVRFSHQVDRRQSAADLRATGRQVLRGLKSKRARVALVLPDWWAWHARHAPVHGAAARARVLASPEGAPPALRPMQRWLQVLYDAAGVNAPGTAWHALRHTYARRFIELGGSLEQLQASLGHASIVTTERIYGHLTDDTAALLARGRIYGALGAAPPNGALVGLP